MSKRNPKYREPKHRGGDLKGSGVFPACCGMTCCGQHGSTAEKLIRSHRRKQSKQAISEGLADCE